MPLPGRWKRTSRDLLSAALKERVLSSLPAEGGVTRRSAASRHKLASVQELLRRDRAGVEGAGIKVTDVPQVRFGFYARSIVVISEDALRLLDAEELQALMARGCGSRIPLSRCSFRFAAPIVSIRSGYCDWSSIATPKRPATRMRLARSVRSTRSRPSPFA